MNIDEAEYQDIIKQNIAFARADPGRIPEWWLDEYGDKPFDPSTPDPIEVVRAIRWCRQEGLPGAMLLEEWAETPPAARLLEEVRVS